MKTFPKVSLYSAIFTAAFLLPSTLFAQSWEPENAWQVDNTRWDISPDSSNRTAPAIPPYIQVETITNSGRCTPITIKADVLDYTISQVFIYYATGNLNYIMHPMMSSPQAPNLFIATLPEAAAQGDYIDYYIEAFNANKTLIATSGNALNPTRIFLTGECPDKAPDAAAQHASTGIKQTPEAQSDVSQDATLHQNASFQNKDRSQSSSTDDTSDPIFQFTVLLGSAFGIISDKTENCDYDARCNGSMNAQLRLGTGIAWLPFHLRASAMFNLPKHFQIGLYVRGQLIDIVKYSLNAGAKANIDFPEQYNIMVGVAARYLVLWEQPYRLYLGLEFGWGGAYASVDMGTDFNNFRDIYLYKGPLHIAPELGFLWNFHKNVGLAVELTIPIVFPERPSAFFDLSLGPFVQF